MFCVLIVSDNALNVSRCFLWDLCKKMIKHKHTSIFLDVVSQWGVSCSLGQFWRTWLDFSWRCYL